MPSLCLPVVVVKIVVVEVVGVVGMLVVVVLISATLHAVMVLNFLPRG
jgi:hypothetical protein